MRTMIKPHEPHESTSNYLICQQTDVTTSALSKQIERPRSMYKARRCSLCPEVTGSILDANDNKHERRHIANPAESKQSKPSAATPLEISSWISRHFGSSTIATFWPSCIHQL